MTLMFLGGILDRSTNPAWEGFKTRWKTFGRFLDTLKKNQFYIQEIIKES